MPPGRALGGFNGRIRGRKIICRAEVNRGRAEERGGVCGAKCPLDVRVDSRNSRQEFRYAWFYFLVVCPEAVRTEQQSNAECTGRFEEPSSGDWR